MSTWQLVSSPTPNLVKEGSAALAASSQDPGFFTSVSSNGTQAGSAIIWAVGRPGTSNLITLYAFAATASGGTYKLLYSSVAGPWPIMHDADVVPVVANGKVYVASYNTLVIFGVPPSGSATVAAPAAVSALSPSSPHVVTGTLREVSGSKLTLQTRGGESVEIDGSQAAQNQKIMGPLTVGEPFTVLGSSYEPTGALVATSIVRAKSASVSSWPSDH